MIGEVTVGQLTPAWSWEIVYDDNSHPDITGGTITGAIREVEAGIVKALTSANFSITVDGSGTPNPVIGYSQVAADVDTPGTWEYLIKVAVASRPLYLRGHFTIKPTFGGL